MRYNNRVYHMIVLYLFISMFNSCGGQTILNCTEKFKKALNLAYKNSNPINYSLLDSALNLTNESLECKTTKKGAVELKIRILITLGNYSQAMLFVDSLKESDFTFRYKKNAMYKNLLAMSNGLKGDTVNQNRIYKEMADDLEKYIRNKNVQGKEFEEIFIDLYTIKDHFLNTKKINIEIDSLKKTYTSKIAFFDFFKK